MQAPKHMFPASKKRIDGVKKDKDRKDVIAYIKATTNI